MTKEQQQLVDFHKKFQLTINDRPTIPLPIDTILRSKLIHEEYLEFDDASLRDNLVDIADALGDLLYVVLGAAVTYGIDLEPVFNEIHRSNMTKLWTCEEINEKTRAFWEEHNYYGICTDEKRCYIVRRKSDGKVIKSPSYSPADLKSVIEKQMDLKWNGERPYDIMK